MIDILNTTEHVKQSVSHSQLNPSGSSTHHVVARWSLSQTVSVEQGSVGQRRV